MMKSFFLYLCKYSGLFLLSNYLLRRKLLILGYHGFEIKNESQFRPQLFIKKETFEKRLKLLRNSPSTVLTLNEAVQALEGDSLPDNAVVITIDDGFYSVLSIALPFLQKYDFPATLYQTTLDMQTGRPIVHMLIAYMIATTTKSTIISSSYKWGIREIIDLKNQQDKIKLMDSCSSFSKKLNTPEDVEQFCNELGNVLGVDYEEIRNSRLLTLLSESEVSMLASKGLDIQLHTHSHRFPHNNIEQASTEIKKNRQILEPLTVQPLIHFCYPDGQWNSLLWPVLKKEGIKSATTCIPGLNDSNTNLLALNRFLDGENITDIVFEAELYRFTELVRILKNRLKWSKIPTENT